MTHLPDITVEQALAILLQDAELAEGPTTRSPKPLEALVGIGKDNYAIIAIQQEDLDALNLLTAERQPSAETRANVVSLNTGQASTDKPSVPDLRSAEQKQTLLEMVETLREHVESGRAQSIAMVAELDEGETYSDFYGGFNATLIGGVAYLQHRMMTV